jgi:membrane protease YdiL (CAAX protease family)
MKKIFKEENVYYLIAIMVTWTLWITAMYVAIKNYVYIPHGDRIISILVNGYQNEFQEVAHFIFSLAVYGPLLGYLFVKLIFKKKDILKFKKFKFKYLLFVLLYPFFIFSFSLLAPFTLGEVNLSYMHPIWAVLVFLLLQLVTSGTEEFGWRGYLQPLFEKKYGFIKASYVVGLMWSVWHYPFIVYLNYDFGVIATIFSLIGFTLLTIPQAIILAWLYKKTNNILLVVFAHAWANTMSLFILGLTTNTMIPTVIIAILTWVLASYLTKEFK